jgi:quinol-cytochrome oxidoreductase complex cytochrome b subunit
VTSVHPKVESISTNTARFARLHRLLLPFAVAVVFCVGLTSSSHVQADQKARKGKERRAELVSATVLDKKPITPVAEKLSVTVNGMPLATESATPANARTFSSEAR